MLNRLSLRKKLLVIPALGFLLTGLVIILMLSLLNRQHQFTGQVVKYDLGNIQHYTSLLSDLSRNHVAIHDLLARKQQLSAVDLQELGRARIAVVQQIYSSLSDQFDQNRAYSDLTIDEPLEQLKGSLSRYINALEQAFLPDLLRQSDTQRLQEANQHLAVSHKHFIGLLEQMGRLIQDESDQQLKGLEEHIRLVTLSVAILLIFLIAYSFRQSSDLSKQLHDMIDVMNQLARGELKLRRKREDYGSHELEQMSEAIDSFHASLRSLERTQNKVEEKNQQLNQEVRHKEAAEAELTHALDALQIANDELEHRVAERTEELAQRNSELVQEVEQRKHAQQQLQLFKMAVHNTSEAVIITDAQAKILEVNPAYCQITGFQREEVLGKNPNITRSNRHDARFYQTMWRSLSSKGHWSGEIWDRRKSGEVFPKWLTINAVYGSQDEHTYYIGVFMDISDMKQTERQLEQLAYYDVLTQLPNRILFQDRLEQEVKTCASENSRFGVLYIDLDRFKYVNDTLGHAIGDQLLVEVAQRIKLCLREPDTVARISGDEFTAIIRSVHEPQDLEVVAGKIIHAIEQPVVIDEREIYVGCSIGISLYPEHGATSETLKKHADIAMYRAKESGRGRYQLFDYQMSAVNVDRMALTGQLKQAIAQREFILHFQPIVDIPTRTIAAVEALIRWQPEPDRIVYPGDFIEHAEETGLIHEIGDWVLESACQQGAEWNRQLEHPVAIAVNLSAVQFENPDLAQHIDRVLQHSGLKPELLHVEITETTVMKHPELTERLLHEISALGVGISIDDFGAGYSSLSYLMRFTANKLKIDRAFTQQLTERRSDQIIPTAIINLGHSLNLQTVAEGVETAFQLKMLEDKGCHYAQGYLFSKPVAVPQAFEMLQQHTLIEQTAAIE
ncbi:bifunctional diguanylate cyclase/phosphodiesterase [Oceanospirillum beijerinckii]|uniref:bifunctional diguanylate cyclase/phosphodiesterase n=1 Tax=Oceanospirillum beijerinckii TaxID=64976 RepID=UPI0003FC5C46|nr:bifunctional diguanylate cyclase/phosphodiesterase [Oceanospirillum beijerinckii]